MKVVVPTTLNFADWLKTVSPPPLPIKRADRKAMTEAEIATAENTQRGLIDPVKINQFIDPAKEVPRKK